MKPHHTALLALALILCAAAIFAFLFFYTVNHIVVVDVSVDALSDFSADGFVVSGDVAVRNDGFLPVGAIVEYEVFLEERLAHGSLEGRVNPKETVRIPFSSEISWRPTAEVAANLLSNKASFVTIKGVVRVHAVEIPFEQQTDITPYLKQFVRETISDLLEGLFG